MTDDTEALESMLRAVVAEFESELETETPAERYVLGMMTREDGRYEHGYTQNGTVGKDHPTIDGQGEAIESLVEKGLMEEVSEEKYRVTDDGLAERARENRQFRKATIATKQAVQGRFGRGLVGFSLDGETDE